MKQNLIGNPPHFSLKTCLWTFISFLHSKCIPVPLKYSSHTYCVPFPVYSFLTSVLSGGKTNLLLFLCNYSFLIDITYYHNVQNYFVPHFGWDTIRYNWQEKLSLFLISKILQSWNLNFACQLEFIPQEIKSIFLSLFCPLQWTFMSGKWRL